MKDFKVFTLRDVTKFSDYHTYPFKGITKRIIDENISKCDILYWAPLEPIDSPFTYIEQSIGVHEFSHLLKERNIEMFVVHSEYDTITFQIENMHILRWKTSLLHYCNSSVEFRYKDIIENVKINDSNFKKLFNSLNLGVRPARVTLLDNLYKYGLFDYGDISWNHITKDDPFKDMGLVFNYWNEERLTLDLETIEPTSEEQIHDTHLWTDYYLESKCLFTVQTESIVRDNPSESHFLSEKTWKPLILGQPFITIGSPGYYEYLQSFGFKLYDEIIDYSFDKVSDNESRIEQIVIELSKLKDRNYDELYSLIKEKVEYNRNLAISITKNDKYIPQKFKELYNIHKESFKKFTPYDMNMDLSKIFV